MSICTGRVNKILSLFRSRASYPGAFSGCSVSGCVVASVCKNCMNHACSLFNQADIYGALSM